MSISRNLHNDITKRVLGANVSFFEKNTQGRILNRFAKDLEIMDNINFLFLEMVDYIVKCGFAVGFLIFENPWITIVALASLFYLLRLRRKCLLVTQPTMRLKFALMSPVNSLIQDAINSLPTLRCLN